MGLLSKKIHVNAIFLAVVEKDALRHFASAGGRENVLHKFSARVPAGRLVNPEDAAGGVSFLRMPAASMIVGQTIQTDRGYSLMVESAS